MTPTNRGLDLSDLSSVTGPEREEFGAFYTSILGHTHRGLDYLLEEDPATLKRYRHYSNVATPNNYESERKVFVFGFLPFYAVIGYDVGVRYLIHTRQKMGLTKAQILEGIAISFLVMGPAGMESVARALDGYTWLTPENPVQFPDGWAPDPGAFTTGLDFSDPRMSPDELRSVQDWYETTLGEIPGAGDTQEPTTDHQRRARHRAASVLHVELALQVFHRGLVRLQPGSMAQEAVDLVGQHQFFVGHTLVPQPVGHVDHLVEIHVAIVITLDQQHRRAPCLHRGDG